MGRDERQAAPSRGDDRPTGPLPAVSVVVPTTGRPDGLARLLAALDRQTLPADAVEIIVVFNGHGARSVLPPARVGPPVRVVRRDPPGRGGACNAGVAVARGELIVFLDDDMAPLPGCLAAHRLAHSGGERRLVLGPVPVIEDRRAGPANWYVTARFRRHLARIGAIGYVPETSDVYTGNASIERRVLQAVGGFDERLVEYGNEDRELATRLVRAGVRIAFAPGAVANQRYDKDLTELLSDSRAKGRTAAAVVARDPSATAATRLARPFGPKRRAARGLLSAVDAIDERPARVVVSGLVRVHRAWALAAVEALVDLEFWKGVGEARAAARIRRVVHVLDSTEFGGAERVLEQLVTGLDAASWQSIVVLPAAARRARERLAQAGVRTVVARLSGRRALLQVATTAATLHRLRPDIVHVQRPWPRAGRVALLAATLANPRAIVVTDHLALGRSSTRRRMLELALAIRVRRWIAVSPHVAAWLEAGMGASPDRIRVVPNGVEIPEPLPAAAPRRPAAAHRPEAVAGGSRDQDPLRLLMVAQLRSQKGHDVLLEAVARVREPVSLTLAGDGPEKAALERHIARLDLGPRVRLAGFVDDVATLLDETDVVVLPSRFEGLPLAVLEAMAAGVAVVATRVPGTADVITDGQTGLLVPPEDPVALAAAIRRLARDPTLRERLARAGCELARSRFDVGRMVEAVESVYREALRLGENRDEAYRLSTRSMPESRLDALLRTIDLRVLTGSVAPASAAAIGHQADALVEALSHVAGTAVRLEPDAGRRFGLVVARDPDPGQASTAAAAVSPGGGLVVLSSRTSGQAAVVRALDGAGLTIVGRYAPWPAPTRPRAWLPIGVRELRAVLELDVGRSNARTMMRAAAALVWRWRVATGRWPIAIVARRGPVGQDSGAADDALGLVGSDGRRWLLLTGGRRSHNRIVALGYARDPRTPERVATVARVPASVAGLQREANALRALAHLGPAGVSGVPSLVDERGEALGTIVVQTGLGGRRLSRTLRHADFEDVADRLADWLVQLIRRADPMPGDAVRRQLVEPLLVDLAEDFGSVLEPRTPERVRRLLEGLGPLPRAIEHRDLAPWNIRELRAGALGVLDWESAELDGVAGPDLHYAIAHLAFDLTGATSPEAQIRVYSSLLDPTTRLGDASGRVLARYAQAAGMALSDLRRTALLTWLIHGRSEYARLAADSGGEPTSGSLRRAFFPRLLVRVADALAYDGPTDGPAASDGAIWR